MEMGRSPVIRAGAKVRVVSASRLAWQFDIPTALLLNRIDGRHRVSWFLLWAKKTESPFTFDKVPDLMTNSGLILLGFFTSGQTPLPPDSICIVGSHFFYFSLAFLLIQGRKIRFCFPIILSCLKRQLLLVSAPCTSWGPLHPKELPLPRPR